MMPDWATNVMGGEVLKWESKSMIFAPNPTGPAHVGTATAFWMMAREALEDDLEIIVRIDDMSRSLEDPLGIETLKLQQESIHSFFEMFDILDVKPAKVYRTTQRQPRYIQVIEELRAAGLVVEAGPPGSLMQVGAVTASDIARGTIPNLRQCVLHHYCLGGLSPLIPVVDAIDFREKCHLRSWDMNQRAPSEQWFYSILCNLWKLPKHGPKHVHIPTICMPDGRMLHKSQGVPPEFYFSEFAKQFSSAQEIRECLERIVLQNDTAYALENILAVDTVRIDATGTRLGERGKEGSPGTGLGTPPVASNC